MTQSNTYTGEPEFNHRELEGIGVLITNLGTPDAPTTGAVRRYLAQFLWDPRVVEAPRWLWWLVLHGVILRFRPARSAHAYRKVWTEAGSPLLTISKAQSHALAQVLNEGPTAAEGIKVALGMRYGKPSIASALEELHRHRCRRLLVLPLYPQYCAATTGSTFDALAAALTRLRWVPELHFISHYHDHPGYIEALVASVREHWSKHGRADRLLLSFHGIPQRYFAAGDPYHCHCQKTARLVVEGLGLADDQWSLSFQSRVGREPWLKPYTDHQLAQWGRDKVGKVQVLCPGFSADCLETLEEIAMQNRDIYVEAGGGTLEYIPALNHRPAHIEALADLVRSRIAPWLGSDVDFEQRQARAIKLGAGR